MEFNELGLIKPLLDAVADSGYVEPTPIQKATIPFVLEGRDVLGCAQTGTGKTAAFALPILQRLFEEPGAAKGKNRPIRALIVTPTRELAIQIQDNFDMYGANLPLKCAVIFGGVKQNPQVEQLKAGVDVLVATPGRLNDLIGQGYVKLDKLRIFVLDEADRMLDMGFINDIRRIMHCLPEVRQTLFFSATMPPEVEHLAMSLLREPSSVKVDPVTSTVESIHQYLFYIDKCNKSKLLADIVKKPEIKSALVFTRTKHGADKVVRDLCKLGVNSMAIHGNKSQNARQDALHRFMSGDIGVLVATDIAARGIDIPELSLVVNYDIPEESETYIHRIGRTGRAGLGGDAVTFCCYDELERLFAVEKLIDRKIEVIDSPYPMEVCTYSDEEKRSIRGRMNSRYSAGSGRSGGGGYAGRSTSSGRPGGRRPSGGSRSGGSGRR